MSANVYEDPTLSRNMRFIRGGENLKCDGEKVERVVDIYESGDVAFTAPKHQRPTRQRGPGGLDPPRVHRNPLRVLTLILALLCLLLVAAVSVILYKLYLLRRIHLSRSELQETRYLNLSNSFCVSGDNGSDSWGRFGCRCYFRFTDQRNWSESRADCVRRGGDLVSINARDEDEFLRKLNGPEESWVGLLAEVTRGEWRWKWSDGSSGTQLSWGVNENMLPTENATAYMNKGGTLSKTTGEKLRGRICERKIKTELF